MWLDAIELTGNTIKLIPLERHHAQNLVEAASDGYLWKLWFTNVPSQDTINEYINYALCERELGKSLAFVVIDLKSNEVIGSTRYCNAEPDHHRLEIGYTWYAKRYQRTAVNTEAKYLLLSYAFESLRCGAVEFRTHHLNQASQDAISRLGAQQDGILRHHRIDSRGEYRNTVVFSILDNEWERVKNTLEKKSGECGRDI